MYVLADAIDENDQQEIKFSKYKPEKSTSSVDENKDGKPKDTNTCKNKKFSCHICDKPFTRSLHLATHMRIHTKEKPFKCDHCNASFPHGNTLTAHLRSHTGEKPYKCPECKACFAQKSNLTAHVRIHTGEKPFICDTCSLGFRQASHLRAHKRTHNNERPYSCLECNKCFTQNSALNRHMRTHIRANQPSSKSTQVNIEEVVSNTINNTKKSIDSTKCKNKSKRLSKSKKMRCKPKVRIHSIDTNNIDNNVAKRTSERIRNASSVSTKQKSGRNSDYITGDMSEIDDLMMQDNPRDKHSPRQQPLGLPWEVCELPNTDMSDTRPGFSKYAPFTRNFVSGDSSLSVGQNKPEESIIKISDPLDTGNQILTLKGSVMPSIEVCKEGEMQRELIQIRGEPENQYVKDDCLKTKPQEISLYGEMNVDSVIQLVDSGHNYQILDSAVHYIEAVDNNGQVQIITPGGISLMNSLQLNNSQPLSYTIVDPKQINYIPTNNVQIVNSNNIPTDITNSISYASIVNADQLSRSDIINSQCQTGRNSIYVDSSTMMNIEDSIGYSSVNDPNLRTIVTRSWGPGN